MTKLHWEEPPARRQVRENHHHVIARQLKRRPGRWARLDVEMGSTGLAAQIKKGIIEAYRPAGSFEAVSRPVDRVTTVYARYVGEPS